MNANVAHAETSIGVHMLRLTVGQIDRVILRCRASLFVGVALMALPFALPRGWGFGVLSGFTLFSLGIYGVAFRKWRTEPGLWMLAVFLTVTLGPCWVYLEFLHVRALFVEMTAKQGARAMTWDQLRLTADAIIALVLYATAVKLAVSVAIENWNRTRVITQMLEAPSRFIV